LTTPFKAHGPNSKKAKMKKKIKKDEEIRMKAAIL
jgi:hypothetical protein